MSATSAPAYVDADLNYLVRDGRRPVTYAGTPPAGVPQRSGTVDSQRCRVHNARVASERPALDRSGFELVQQPTAVRDFTSDDRIRELY